MTGLVLLGICTIIMMAMRTCNRQAGFWYGMVWYDTICGCTSTVACEVDDLSSLRGSIIVLVYHFSDIIRSMIAAAWRCSFLSFPENINKRRTKDVRLMYKLLR